MEPVEPLGYERDFQPIVAGLSRYLASDHLTLLGARRDITDKVFARVPALIHWNAASPIRCKAPRNANWRNGSCRDQLVTRIVDINRKGEQITASLDLSSGHEYHFGQLIARRAPDAEASGKRPRPEIGPADENDPLKQLSDGWRVTKIVQLAPMFLALEIIAYRISAIRLS